MLNILYKYKRKRNGWKNCKELFIKTLNEFYSKKIKICEIISIYKRKSEES